MHVRPHWKLLQGSGQRQLGSRLHSHCYRTSNPGSDTGHSTKLMCEPHIFTPLLLHHRPRRRKHLWDGHWSPKRCTRSSERGGSVSTWRKTQHALSHLSSGWNPGEAAPETAQHQIQPTDFSTGWLLSRIAPHHLDKAEVLWFGIPFHRPGSQSAAGPRSPTPPSFAWAIDRGFGAMAVYTITQGNIEPLHF